MKSNLNKILLESIKHGVSLALDNFEDQDDIQQLSSGKIKDIDMNLNISVFLLKSIMAKAKNLHKFYHALYFNPDKIDLEYINVILGINGPEANTLLKCITNKINNTQDYTDLYLPSGTLWCNLNLGRINNENDYAGDFYQWGLTTIVNSMHGTYQINDNYKDILTSEKLIFSYIDLEDDPAYHINNHFRTPTIKQFKELVDNTIQIDLVDSCYAFVSKENPLNFIIVSNRNELYMTADINNKNILPMAKTDIIGNNKLQIYFVKLFSYNSLEFKVIPFKSLSNGSFPPVTGHIRPIYIK